MNDTEEKEKMISHGKEIVVFTGNSNPALAEQICADLYRNLGNTNVSHFADGECSVSVYEPVRGKDVFIVQSTCKPVNDNLMELLIMIDAMRRASAGRVTAVIRTAEARRQASIMMSSSIRLSLTGLQVDCTMNTSLPRTDSYSEQETSPSAKPLISFSPSLMPMALQMSAASFGLALPVNTLMSLP